MVAPVRERHNVGDGAGPVELEHEFLLRSLSPTGEWIYHRRKSSNAARWKASFTSGNTESVGETSPRSFHVRREEVAVAEPWTRTVERALALLATICERGGANLADSARDCDLAPSTALRLLRTLETTGFVRREEAGGTYRPGARIIQLGAQALSNESLIDLAKPAMEKLVAETGESAYLSRRGARRDSAVHRDRRGNALRPAPQLGGPHGAARQIGRGAGAARPRSRCRIRRGRARRRGRRHGDRVPRWVRKRESSPR